MTKARIEMLSKKTEKYLKTPHGKCRWRTNSTSGYSVRQNLVAAVMISCRLANFQNIADVVDFLSKNTAKVIEGRSK